MGGIVKYILPLTLVLFISCSRPMTKVKSDLANARNPLIQPWSGEYGGVPAFDKVAVEDFKPAVAEAILLCRQDYQAIVKNPEAPTFENTIEALEKSCPVFGRVMAIYGVWSSSKNNEEFQKIDEELSPQLAAFRDEYIQNVELFQRVEKVYNSKQKSRLSPEQKRLLTVYYEEFVLNGARLTAEQKEKVADINKRLAVLSTKFSSNLLADEKNDGLLLENISDLAGVPQALIDSAASEATKRGFTGKWLIVNTRSSMEPFLTSATKRDLREKAFRKWTSRGENNNANNNLEIVSEIAALRAERSKIMGFQSYSHWRLMDR
jgi:peptidyl-dipeptidase Dcp